MSFYRLPPGFDYRFAISVATEDLIRVVRRSTFDLAADVPKQVNSLVGTGRRQMEFDSFAGSVSEPAPLFLTPGVDAAELPSELSRSRYFPATCWRATTGRGGY